MKKPLKSVENVEVQGDYHGRPVPSGDTIIEPKRAASDLGNMLGVLSRYGTPKVPQADNPNEEQDKLPPDELTEQDELRDDFSVSADPEKIGRALASLRKRAGLTQEDVAKVMDSNAKFVGRVERGATNPTLDTLNGYARAIGRKIEFSFVPD